MQIFLVRSDYFLRVLTRIFWVWVLFSCTMPLPEAVTVGKSAFVPENTAVLPEPLRFQSARIPLPDVVARTGLHNGNSVSYLDLNACGRKLLCSNELSLPLSFLTVYEFYSVEGNPIPEQFPVFSATETDQNSTPFRQVVKVIVPAGYIPNTLRSASDIRASQFRTEVMPGFVRNLPLVTLESGNSLPLRVQQAWLNQQSTFFLDLGRVPYSAVNRRLGVGLVYFLRNRDNTDLPSNPAPIFDAAPGELLYSPIRQVFRAVSENQVFTQEGDLSRSIRSQADLLNAVNQGLFKLEDTGKFFNYPVLTQDMLMSLTSGQIYTLSISGLAAFPELPENSHYVLWGVSHNDEKRMLFRFRAVGNTLLDLQNQPQLPGSSIFRFSDRELGQLRRLQVALTTDEKNEGVPFLEAPLNSSGLLTLRMPFQDRYQQLQAGNLLLAAPSGGRERQASQGIWFVRRQQDGEKLPLASELEPGLVLSLPPAGWVYQGWVLYQRQPEKWLSTGRFQAPGKPDNSFQNGHYLFPGEDFLATPPSGFVFPFDPGTTGESEVVVSLEPEHLVTQQPFIPLFQTTLPKASRPFQNRIFPPALPLQPSMDVQIKRASVQP
jgi:hypothetical protein